MDLQWLLTEYKALKEKPNRTQHEEGQLYILNFIDDIAKQSSVIVNLELLEKLIDSLYFYGDPSNYVGIAFLGDAPCGDFAEDFSEVEIYGEKPGKKAREVIEYLLEQEQFVSKYNKKIEEKYVDPESTEDE